MRERPFAYRRIGIAQRSEFVLLVLKNIGVDGAGPDTRLPGRVFEIGGAIEPVGQVPQHMQCYGGTRAGQFMHLSGIGQLFRRGGRGGGLHELSKTGSGICKTPRRQLDRKGIEHSKKCVGLVRRAAQSGISVWPGFSGRLLPLQINSPSIDGGRSMIAFAPALTETEIGPAGDGTVPDTSGSPLRFGEMRTRLNAGAMDSTPSTVRKIS